MKGERPPADAPRVVKPRKEKMTAYRDIIALGGSHLLLERTGEVYPADTLPALIAVEPSSIIVCQGFGSHLERIVRVHGEKGTNPDPRFNYRVTPHYRENAMGHAVQVLDCVCNFVGFAQVKANKAKKIKTVPSRYHYPLDPVQFIRQSIDELRGDIDNPDNDNRLAMLLAWAQEVRQWCLEQGVEVKPSSGGLVAQLLRNKRFYSDARRKCPRLINDTARSQLPGNYYRLHVPRNEPYKAIYLDMSSAHHTVAQRIRFPDVNTLHAYGRFGDANHDRGRRPVAGGQSPLLRRPGLFKLGITVPHLREADYPPPWGWKPGTYPVWVYSNELELIEELGIQIQCVYAAYVSEATETGLNNYARWALEQIRDHPTLKPWLKPTLHSTYGVLAAKPRPFETGFYRAAGGESWDYPMGPASIHVQRRTTKKPIESKLANVIHRGMIEAEVRKESLSMARFLTQVDRRQVLAVYADSVFILDTGKPLRVLPPWWRISTYTTNLRFLTPTHFTSDELVRLPGFSRRRSERELQARRRLLEGQKVQIGSRTITIRGHELIQSEA